MGYDYHDGPNISLQYPIDENYKIRIRAEDVRRERTGVHAFISIDLLTPETAILLENDTLNVGRREDRMRLANAAWKLLGETLQSYYAQEFLQHALIEFCGGLWNAHLEALRAEDVEGDPNTPAAATLVEHLILAEAGTICFAPPGQGKSFLLQILATSVQHGSRILFRVPEKPTPTLTVNLERSRSSVRARLGRINLALGLQADAKLPMINARGKTFADVLPTVLRHVEKHGTQIVFLDSISRTGYGDLTLNQVANQIADGLNSLGCAWFALAHSPRDSNDHIFGSQLFDAAADVIIKLSSERKGNLLGIGLQHSKANDLPPMPLSIYALEFERDGLVMARRAKAGEFLAIEAGRTMSLDDRIIEYLLKEGKADAGSIAEALGVKRNTVSEYLNKDKRFIHIESKGKLKLYGVLDRSM